MLLSFPFIHRITFIILDESRVIYIQCRIFYFARLLNFRQVRNFQKLLLYNITTRFLVVREVLEQESFVFYREGFAIDLLEKLNLVLNLGFDFSLINSTITNDFLISKKRGLSFFFQLPNLYVRCLESLFTKSVLPVIEMKTDRFSYGFRPYRGKEDLFLAIKKILSKGKSGFWASKFKLSNIFKCNNWLLNNFPFEKNFLKGLLEKDYLLNFSSRPFACSILNFLLNGFV